MDCHLSYSILFSAGRHLLVFYSGYESCPPKGPGHRSCRSDWVFRQPTGEKGDVFDQSVALVLLNIRRMVEVLEGLKLELEDFVFPSLRGVHTVTSEKEAFQRVDCAFLVGIMPRGVGMERTDLQGTGKTLADYAKPTTKVAKKAGIPIGSAKNVIIWGNHSSAQFPDVQHAQVYKNSPAFDASAAINDPDYAKGQLITVGRRN